MVTLGQMVARQKALGRFGDFALRCDSLDDILHEACRLVGHSLDADFSKILEIAESGDLLLIKAGFGWTPGVVGSSLRMAEESSETYSIRLGEPVVVQDITTEKRFAFPSFLQDHGIRAMVNVPIFLPQGRPYGLLQVDATAPRPFGEHDIRFLLTYAAILGPVIDRLHKAHSLRAALEANRRLLLELQHRVKNHIAIVAGLVNMRVRHVTSEEARSELAGIGARVETLRLVHEQLYVAGTTERIGLRPFLTALAGNLCRLHGGEGKVHLETDLEDVELSPDLAVPLGLIVNEFVTNSLKHAFDGRGGTIRLAGEVADDDRLRLLMRDDGKGLPRGDVEPSGTGTGMKLIRGLAGQINAETQWSTGGGGTGLSLDLPRAYRR